MIRLKRKYILMKLLSLIILGTAVLSLASEKDLRHFRHHRESKIKNRKISARLNNLISRKSALKAINGKLSTSDTGYKALKKDEVRVIFKTTEDVNGVSNKIRTRGGRILKKRKDLVAVEVSLDKIEDMVTNVDSIDYVRLPHKFFPLGVISEGANLTGANNFHSAGFTGTGVKIAVIDLGFKGLSEAISNGDLPYDVITYDFTGNGIQTESKHGTACAEIVHDMAPDAELHLLKGMDEVDGYNALDYCADNDIDIISFSMGTFGSGPGDGTGPVDEAFDDARSNGIFVVAAAGNKANSRTNGITIGSHWKGTFYDSDGDDVHEFIQGNSESYYNVIGAFPDQDDDGNPKTSEVRILMRWNDWPSASIDYDIYLHDYDTNELVDVSNAIQDGSQPPIEKIVIDLPDSQDYLHKYTLFVEKPNGEPSGTELELFLGGTSKFLPIGKSPIATSSSSITEPADAQSVFTVGAINYNNWTTGPQEDFSSQGPTNAWAGSSERIKPDICGPDGVSGYTYGESSFRGTSAAAPYVAGAAALILSMHPNLTPDELQSLIESNAIDMGSTGKDNFYGWGKLSVNVFNNTPVLDPIGNNTVNVHEGDLLRFTVSGSDPDMDSLTYSAFNLPPGAIFESENLNFQWKPNFTQAGVYTIRIEVSDGRDNNSEQIIINVYSAPPVGDIDGSETVDLIDALLALQVLGKIDVSGQIRSDYITSGADVNGDGNIGLEEVIYIIQDISWLR